MEYNKTSNPAGQWLDRATAGIRFKPDREEVRAELEEHLEDKALDFQCIFPDLTEAEARERAVSEMGDPMEIGKELARIHKPWLGYLWRASRVLIVLLVLWHLWCGMYMDHYYDTHTGRVLWDFDDLPGAGEERQSWYGSPESIHAVRHTSEELYTPCGDPFTSDPAVLGDWLEERVRPSSMLYVDKDQLDALYEGNVPFTLGFLRSDCPDCRFRFLFVAGRHNHHIRERPQNCQIFCGVMAHPQRAVHKSAAHTDNLHICLMIRAVIPDLFQAPECRKVSDGICKYGLSLKRHACCHSRHILFCDSRVSELIRDRFPERFQNAKPQISCYQFYIFILLRKLNQSFYKCISHDISSHLHLSDRPYLIRRSGICRHPPHLLRISGIPCTGECVVISHIVVF